MVTESLPWLKRQRLDTDHQPPSSADVKEREELCFCSPSVPSWLVIGRTLISTLPNIRLLPWCRVVLGLVNTKCIVFTLIIHVGP
jgi:hypothetical protein